MAKTIQANQVADAFVTVPGKGINLLDNAFTTDRTSTSDTFITISDGNADEASGSFETPFAGTYMIRASVGTFAQTATGENEFQLLFDDGESNEQSIRESNWETVHSETGIHLRNSFLAFVELTAGTHTIAAQWRRKSGGTHTMSVNALDPVKVDAILLSGSGVGGEIVYRDELSGTVEITSVYTTYDDIQSLTITVKEGEQPQISWSMRGRPNAAAKSSTQFRIYDATTSTELWRGLVTAQDWNEYRQVNPSFAPEGLSAGMHLIKAQACRNTAGEANWLVQGSLLTIKISRGGQVPIEADGTEILATPRAFNFSDDFGIANIDNKAAISSNIVSNVLEKGNLPLLEYNSASVVDIVAAPGKSNTALAKLSDDKIYTATLPLTMNITTSGVGGLDTGSEASDTWYYLYLVPDGNGGDICDVVASVTYPDGGGPTGFSAWKYIGYIRNNDSSNIIPFVHFDGNRFQMWIGSISLGTGTDASPVQLDLSSYIPKTAVAIDAEGFLRMNSTGTSCSLALYPSGFQSFPLIGLYIWASGNVADHESQRGIVAVPDSSQEVYYQKNVVTGTVSESYLRIMCAIDGWLKPSESTTVLSAVTRPENIPVLDPDNFSGDTFKFKANAGASSQGLITLNDGLQYKVNLPYDMDLDTTGYGGMEASATLADGDLYNYAVANPSTPGWCEIICSDQDPSSGPADYATWAYLGPLWRDSGALVNLRQEGEWFHYDSRMLGNNLGTVSQARTNEAISYLPTTVDFFSCDVEVSVTSGVVNIQIWEKGITPTPKMMVGNAPVGGFRTYGTLYAPDQTADVQLNFGSGTVDFAGIRVRCFRDKYLAGRTRTQAQVTNLADTKSPKGIWATTSTVNFAARPGQPTTVRKTGSDNKQRYMTSGTWDISNGVADWGYDEAGSQGNSKWLYFYLVPKSGDDTQWVVRASDNPPSTGPAGYSVYIHVWSTYIDGSGNLIEVVQRGNNFQKAYSNYDLGTSADATPVALDISTAVPVSAGAVFMVGRIQGDDTAYRFVQLHIFAEGPSNPRKIMEIQCRGTGVGYGQMFGEVIIQYGSQQLYYQKIVNTGPIASSDIKVSGWVDESVEA